VTQILPAVFTATPFVLAVALGILLPMLALLCYRHFAAGVWLIALSFLVDVYFQQSVGLELGLRLYSADLVLALVGAIGGWRWLVASDHPRRHWAWLLYAAVFFVVLVMGVAKSGTAAGVQARNDFYSLATATYVMSFPVGQRQVRQLADMLVWTAVLLVGLCVYRWIVYYAPIRDLLPPGGSYNIDGPIRVVPSYAALSVAQALLLGIFFTGVSRGTQLARLASPLLLAAVVVLQHRSVWLAAMVGVLVALFIARQRQASQIQQVVMLGAITLVTAAALVLGDRGGTLSGQLSRSAGTAIAGQGTAFARVENWRATLADWVAAGPRAIAIGRGFGSDTTRYTLTESGERRKITYGAHNHYVSTLSGMGIVGLAAWLWTLGYVLVGLFRMSAQGQGGGAAAGLLVLMCTQLVYYVAYGTDYMQFLIFGVAMAYVAQSQRLSRPVPDSLLPAQRGRMNVAWVPRGNP
jgi:O-Antigen ligase